jgi:hypothetical protein
MTLFRKVFQNQSHPASGEDLPDENELRKAFMETEEGHDPLALDPFACDDEIDGDVHDDAETSEKVTILKDDADDEASDTSFPYEEPEEAHDLTAGDWSEADAGGLEPESPDTEEEVATFGESDADIAAFLDRAMAAEPPQALQAVTEDADDEEALSTAAPAGEDGEVAVSDPKEEAVPPSLDVADFAQQQMAALDAEVEPSMEQGSEDAAQLDLSHPSAGGLAAVPAPAPGRAGRRAGRVKTRLLGFNRGGEVNGDPFGQAPEATASAQREKFPVGWLVIVEGPGVGHSFSIFTGASMIGRGEDQVIRLDFGDNSISRHNHAAIAYDEEENKFYIGHGGKSNIIRRNARPVLSTEELHHADLIRIGETTLRFVALCGSDFQWQAAGGAHDAGL